VLSALHCTQSVSHSSAAQEAAADKTPKLTTDGDACIMGPGGRGLGFTRPFPFVVSAQNHESELNAVSWSWNGPPPRLSRQKTDAKGKHGAMGGAQQLGQVNWALCFISFILREAQPKAAICMVQTPVNPS
jgi:hypothetical protein